MNHIKVKVFPGSDKNEVIRKSKESFEVKTQEEAKEGKANKVVLSLLSRFLSIDSSRIKLVKGGKKKNKIFEIK